MSERDRRLPDAMRVLVRHQWVREHGTPRVTVLAGPRAGARRLWTDWQTLSGRDLAAAVTLETAASADPRAARPVLERAIARAALAPRQPIAVIGPLALIERVGAGPDRIAAMVQEGLVRVTAIAGGARAGARGRDAAAHRARSLAELTLFEALEATEATAGRFQLNQRVTARFGPADAEVDLLARAESIAIEIDGFHHFTDPDAYRRDRRKDLLLQARGFLVVRVLADDVHADPRAAVRMVCEALAHRASRARVSRGS